MAKTKEKSELEHLRAENKALTKQIKHLKKQLGSLEKRKHLHDDTEEKLAEMYLLEEKQDLIMVENKDECPNCGPNGDIEKIEIGNRIIIVCHECKYRTSLRK